MERTVSEEFLGEEECDRKVKKDLVRFVRGGAPGKGMTGRRVKGVFDQGTSSDGFSGNQSLKEGLVWWI